MALTYTIMSTNRPGEGKAGTPMYFPKLTGTSQTNLRQLSKILAMRSTASEADVYLVVTGLINLIPQLLTEGKTVKLDGLGTFRLHARVDPASSPDKVTARNIRELRMSFRPDNEIKRELNAANVKKA